MGALLARTHLETALLAYAVAAPVIFAAVSTRYFRRRIYDGTSEIQRLVIARELLRPR